MAKKLQKIDNFRNYILFFKMKVSWELEDVTLVVVRIITRVAKSYFVCTYFIIKCLQCYSCFFC